MSKIYCSNCGRNIPRNDNFCRFCGAAQHGPAAAAYQASAPPQQLSAASFVIDTAKEQPTPTRGSRGSHSEDQTDESIDPNTHYMKRQHLCKIAKWSFFINYVGATAVLPILFFIGGIFEPIISIVVFVAYFVMLYLISDIVHNNFYFSIDENGFNKEHGIIHKQEVSIPYSRIQNVNITRGLIDRMLGLARISIETAGSNSIKARDIVGGGKTKAEGYLPGITLAQAKKAHDLLLNESRKHSTNDGV